MAALQLLHNEKQLFNTINANNVSRVKAIVDQKRLNSGLVGQICSGFGKNIRALGYFSARLSCSSSLILFVGIYLSLTSIIRLAFEWRESIIVEIFSR